MYIGGDVITDEITTIRIHQSIKKLIDKKKVHPRETYEQVIKRLLTGGE